MKKIITILVIVFSAITCFSQENFYKITKVEATTIGRFEYEKNKIFDPFVGEQTDGNYIVSEKMYVLLKNTPQFKKVNWSKKALIPKNNLKPKIITIK